MILRRGETDLTGMGKKTYAWFWILVWGWGNGWLQRTYPFWGWTLLRVAPLRRVTFAKQPQK